MSTLSELIARVRSEIIEPQPGLYTDAEITSWLNEANDDLVEIYGVEAVTTFQCQIDTEFYALPADFGRTRLLERELTAGAANYRPLQALSETFRQERTGAPMGYYQFAGQLGLIPIPNVSVQLRHYYYKIPALLVNASDTSPIPTQFHRLLYLYAVGEAKRKADDTAYQTYINDYVAGRQDMIEKKTQRKLSSERFQIVRDVG